MVNKVFEQPIISIFKDQTVPEDLASHRGWGWLLGSMLVFIMSASVVAIVTRYWLDSLRIKSQWGWDFLHLSRPAVRPTQPPIQWVPCLFRG